MIRMLVCCLPLVACVSGSDDSEVVGPFTGETRRFVVDSITVPHTNTEARELGGDLTGDERVDNQLGMVIATLSNMGNVTTHGSEIIAAGAVASSVEITADSFTNDRTVSVRLVGADGEDATATGGRFVDGAYVSNRTATTDVVGSATLHLPVFVHADPSVVPVIGMQIELVPDGLGGYDAAVHGAVPHPLAIEMAYRATLQMLASYPSEHIGFLGLFDSSPRDWMLTHDEFTRNSLIVALMAPDVRLDGTEALSLGIRMHLSPCAEGTCLTSQATCFDRVQNGDETDVDCGGACRGCVAGSACDEVSDCETAVCTAGVCGPASCANGVRDAFESDADCGTFCGTACAAGKRCYYASDCQSGACGVPCDPESYYCGNDYDVCR